MKNASVDVDPQGVIVVMNYDEDALISKIEFHKGHHTNNNTYIDVIFNNEKSYHRQLFEGIKGYSAPDLKNHEIAGENQETILGFVDVIQQIDPVPENIYKMLNQFGICFPKYFDYSHFLAVNGRPQDAINEAIEVNYEGGIDRIMELIDFYSNKKSDQHLMSLLKSIPLGSLRYKSPVDATLKFAREFDQNELHEYFQQCKERLQNNPDDVHAKYLGFALICELMYRLKGEYPTNTDITFLIEAIFGNNTGVINNNGQNYNMIDAIYAAIGMELERKDGIIIMMSNQKLAECFFKEYKDFFKYFNIPIALVTSSTTENIHENATVICSTTSDYALYTTQQKTVDKSNSIAFDESVATSKKFKNEIQSIRDNEELPDFNSKSHP